MLLHKCFIFSQEDGEEFESPLFFKLKNKSNEFYQVCGVNSVPTVLLRTICYEYVRYYEGETINIELVNPPEGNFIKLDHIKQSL